MKLARCVCLPCMLVSVWGAGLHAQSTAPANREAGASGSLLVFCALADDNWDLYSWDCRTEHAPVRLTRTPYDEMSPSLAPDHSHVIYQSADGRLWRLDLKPGSVPHPLPYGSDQKLDMHPAIAPDSVRVVLATSLNRATDDTDLIILHQAMSSFGPRLVMPSFQHYPAWSPDGRTLAFSNLHARPVTGSVISEIWTMRTDGTGARQLTLLDGQSVSPRWSPDGREVVFASNSGGNFDLWTVEVTSRQVRRLTDDAAAETGPIYSPDGQSILFVSDQGGDLGLWRMRPGGAPAPLSPFGKAHPRPCKDPDWK